MNGGRFSRIFIFPRNLTHSYLRLNFSYTAQNSSLNMKHVFYLKKTTSYETRFSLQGRRMRQLTSTKSCPSCGQALPARPLRDHHVLCPKASILIHDDGICCSQHGRHRARWDWLMTVNTNHADTSFHGEEWWSQGLLRNLILLLAVRAFILWSLPFCLSSF